MTTATSGTSGRLDDMFKVKGATVYPTEVETALRSVPGVAQAFVTNVTAGGIDQVAALVVSALDVGDLDDAVRARLSSFKVPTIWLAVTDASAAPMSATGKIDKQQLQRLLASRGSSVGLL